VNGWQPFQDQFGRIWNTCASRDGSVGATLNESATVSTDSKIGWVFTAPSGLTIENYSVYRYARSGGTPDRSRDYWLYNDAPVFDNQYRFPQEVCSFYLGCSERGTAGGGIRSSANRFEERGLSLKQLYLINQCRAPDAGGCPPTSPGSSFTLYSARIGLSDISPPTFRVPPTGSLMAPGAVLTGERTVRFDASDVGGGLARAAIVVDDQSQPEQPVDLGGTTCRAPYTTPAPCALSAAGLLSLDTAQFPNGPHKIQIALIDAGENRTLSEPIIVSTQNGGRPNGIGASRFVKLSVWTTARGNRSASRTVTYGRTAWIHGRLRATDGTPIRGATLDVSALSRRLGARTRPLAPVQTDEKGRFALRPRPGSSRTFTVQYRAFTLDDVPVACERVRIDVRAGVRLQVRPHRISPRGRIRFTGRLVGGPGRAGTHVGLFAVARHGRDRVPVATVRADRRGRFHFSYRFRRTFAPFTYYFQAVVQRQNGYPYATGKSRRVSVRIVG
jgi:hypothetical protein